jgi:acyl-CoA thioesterase
VAGTFDQATSVEMIQPGSWQATIDATWAIGDTVHGGFAQCVVTRAALNESGHPHPVASSAHFLAPTNPGTATVSVQVLRAGRTASTVRAVLVQDGVEKLVAHVTAATLGPEPPDYEVEQPAVPEPSECMPRPERLPDGSQVRFLDPVEIRLDPRHVGGPHEELSGVPAVRGWVRARDCAPPDTGFLIFSLDALPPSVLEIGGLGWSPTVQMSTYVRALPAPGWLMVVSRASAVSDGWFDEEAEAWDSRGRLVAQARQLGRVRLAATSASPPPGARSPTPKDGQGPEARNPREG